MNAPVLNGTVTFPEGSSLPATTADWTEAELYVSHPPTHPLSVFPPFNHRPNTDCSAALVFGAVALFTSSLLTGFINLYRDVPYVRVTCTANQPLPSG